MLAGPRQRLDACAGRLPRALRANAQIHHTHLTRVAAKLSPRLLRQRLTRGNEIVASLGERSRRARRTYLDQRAQRLRSAWQLLNAYSYRKVLERGFALVRDDAGHPLRSAAAVGGGMRLDIEFSDGRVGATADGERTTPPAEKIKAANARRRTGFRRAGQSFRLLIIRRGFRLRGQTTMLDGARPAMGGRFCSIAMIDPRR